MRHRPKVVSASIVIGHHFSIVAPDLPFDAAAHVDMLLVASTVSRNHVAHCQNVVSQATVPFPQDIPRRVKPERQAPM